MYVLHAPVLISRMKQKERTENVTAAGIHADSVCSPCILQGIIHGSSESEMETKDNA